MTSWAIEFSPRAAKELRKLDRPVQKRIVGIPWVNKKLAPAGASLCLLLHLDVDGACCWVEGDVAVLEVHALEAVNFKDGAGG